MGSSIRKCRKLPSVFHGSGSNAAVNDIGLYRRLCRSFVCPRNLGYARQCASWRGNSGKWDGPAGQYLSPKPTDFATSLKGKSDDWIAKAISGGGAAVGGSTVMPPFPNLSANQVKGLVDYVKQLGSQRSAEDRINRQPVLVSFD